MWEQDQSSRNVGAALLCLLAVACLLSGAGCGAMSKQDTARGSTVTVAEGVAENFGGHWKGPMRTKNKHDGTMELTLVRNGNELKASAKFYDDVRFSASPVKNLEVTGDEISFATNILGADVHFKGKVGGENMGGSLEALQRSSSVDTGNWDLTRTTRTP
jgi:hypothetical protein